MIKFSILVPAYKAQFLEECIDSILAQTYKNFELIIVNDASPQNLDSIVSKYDDPRIRYYKNKVGFGAEHVVGNWNKCLEYATGDYIICMGDDDKLVPNSLEEYCNLLEKKPDLNVYHAWTEIINEDSDIYDINEPRPEYESVYSLIYYRMRGRQQYIGDFLFKTDVLKENGGFYDLPMGWGSDDLSVFIAANKTGIANTQMPAFLYRRSESTLSSSGNTSLQLSGIKKEVEWIKAFIANPPADPKDKIYCKKIQTYLPIYSYKRTISTLVKDYNSNGLRLLYWLKNKRKNDLKWGDILMSALHYLRER